MARNFCRFCGEALDPPDACLCPACGRALTLAAGASDSEAPDEPALPPEPDASGMNLPKNAPVNADTPQRAGTGVPEAAAALPVPPRGAPEPPPVYGVPVLPYPGMYVTPYGYAPPGAYGANRQEYPPNGEPPELVTFSSALMLSLIGLIPVAGLIYLLFQSFLSAAGPNRRNFARGLLTARLILTAVALILFIFVILSALTQRMFAYR